MYPVPSDNVSEYVYKLRPVCVVVCACVRVILDAFWLRFFLIDLPQTGFPRLREPLSAESVKGPSGLAGLIIWGLITLLITFRLNVSSLVNNNPML